ncbi:hypothetical protein Cgig2_007782 [Carnegiea gigantea]|uniref:Uncharacterized protein n=1 Tax=Carnegiea gigantea TaxID=171969 RepID=A0A9Q1K106_9CARY|nr:hypothetical protein Cgig2_007782 [Carnegiea gigantea]
MLRGWMLSVMESALSKLRWSTFQGWVERNRDKILEARQRDYRSRGRNFALHLVIAFPPFCDTEEMADHVRETFKWRLRKASHPPPLLLEDFQDLYPSFTLPDAEEAACDFNILEIVQATFYMMEVNDVVELSTVSKDVAGDLRSTLKGLQWTSFESWLSVNKCALLEAQLCQRIPLGGNLGTSNS